MCVYSMNQSSWKQNSYCDRDSIMSVVFANKVMRFEIIFGDSLRCQSMQSFSEVTLHRSCAMIKSQFDFDACSTFPLPRTHIQTQTLMLLELCECKCFIWCCHKTLGPATKLASYVMIEAGLEV